MRIIEEESIGKFIRGNPIEIPSTAFLFCLLHYRDHFAIGSSALNVADICLAEYSPGRVFNIPEFQVRALLSESHANGLIRMEQFANLDQVRLPDTTTQQSVLRGIYGG